MHIFSVVSDPLAAGIFWASFYFWFFVFETWVSLRNARTPSPLSYTDKRSALFLLIAFYVGIFSALAAAFLVPRFSLEKTGTHTMLFLGGIFLLWVGIALRLWSVRTLGKYFRTLVLVRPDHELIIAGPYRYLRHPAYTGSLLSVFGFALALDNRLSLVVVALTIFPAYLWRIHVEEEVLKKHFPDTYLSYAQKTRRLIPFVW